MDLYSSWKRTNLWYKTQLPLTWASQPVCLKLLCWKRSFTSSQPCIRPTLQKRKLPSCWRPANSSMTPWLRETQVQPSWCNGIHHESFFMYQRNRVYDTAGVAIFTLEVAVMVDVFGISYPQAVFRMEWLVTVKSSALITGIRYYLFDFQLRNSKN